MFFSSSSLFWKMTEGSDGRLKSSRLLLHKRNLYIYIYIYSAPSAEYHDEKQVKHELRRRFMQDFPQQDSGTGQGGVIC